MASGFPPVAQPSPCTKLKSAARTRSTKATSPRTTASSILCSSASTSAAASDVEVEGKDLAGRLYAAQASIALKKRKYRLDIGPHCITLTPQDRLKSGYNRVPGR